MLAPGEGEAEPGEPNQHTSQPTKWATDDRYKKIARREGFSFQNTPTGICRQLCRLSELAARYPRLGFAIAWGYDSARQLRRLVE